MENNFNFCPHCGGKNIHNVNMRAWQCDDCGFVLYHNVAAAVAVIITDESGNILFEVRAKEPKRGMLCLPGGFVEPGETLEQACVRECVEEIGIKPLNLKYMATFPNNYEYKGLLYKTCDAFFVATIPDKTEFSLQKTEVNQTQWIFIKTVQDIDNLPIAFDSARCALKFFISGN